MNRVVRHPIFDAFVLAFLFMWLAPVGSFDPSSVGFWASIAFGFVTSFTIRLLLTEFKK